ncbi:hypothetical protein KCP77_00030 [Salmonella enterica subsp. enterica]|nr:hypothetical protein KCP77_00030 [Salmonella enterica subsp. enterica]
MFISARKSERRLPRYYPRPSARKRLLPDHGWETLLMRITSDLPLRLPPAE